MEATLEVSRRETSGKNEARRLRAQGRIPAVLYGGATAKEATGGETGESLAVDPKALSKILHSASGVNTLIALKLGDAADNVRVLVKEYQLDPVTHHLLHADFYRIRMDQTLQVTVPVHLIGEAKGIKLQGAVVDFVHREVEIECLPGDIPSHLDVDVTELMIGQGIRVRDLDAGGKWTAVSDPDTLLVHAVAPKAEAEPEPEEAAAAAAAAPGAPAEPEVIKKGKTEKEGEEK